MANEFRDAAARGAGFQPTPPPDRDFPCPWPDCTGHTAGRLRYEIGTLAECVDCGRRCRIAMTISGRSTTREITPSREPGRTPVSPDEVLPPVLIVYTTRHFRTHERTRVIERRPHPLPTLEHVRTLDLQTPAVAPLPLADPDQFELRPSPNAEPRDCGLPFDGNDDAPLF